MEHRSTPISRSAPESVQRPVMVQYWTDVVFIHWPLPPEEVQALLPDGVEVDTFDGNAWVGLVPFRMEGLGLPGLAPLPMVGSFPEVNVRTYVRSGPRRGVWFFSLDVDRLLPALVARAAYALPYCKGDTSHHRMAETVSSSVRRTWPGGRGGPAAMAELVVHTGDPIDVGPGLESFLTSRWGLVSASRGGRLRWAPVEHPKWPLFSGELAQLDETLLAAAGLDRPAQAPHVMWSPGVPVRVGRPVSLSRVAQRR
ncbi:MAG: DUF2071 domain-containing protein [Actinomycetia bacterium]|nr:DUF2071 domain-containing protein [Actinomycetes bacterium]